jgi:mersacidin/lichenicidin family type 2 lantibiotic
MAKQQIIRAWKDPAYRNSLSAAERAALPANPAGGIELSDRDLGKVAGGKIVWPTRYNFCSFFCTIRDCLTSALTCTVKLP